MGQSDASRAAPPGEHRSGAPAPKGELSGQRDNLDTEEALDQGGYYGWRGQNDHWP
jgi:hypothetical protein